MIAFFTPCHRVGYGVPDPLGSLDEMIVGKAGVACRGLMPPVPEQFADGRQILARHDGMTCGGMSQVMQPAAYQALHPSAYLGNTNASELRTRQGPS